ncbi:MAG: SUMF1/EgtB/PvdO family nonheme iron enzyme [Myxococcota bacterium]
MIKDLRLVGGRSPVVGRMVVYALVALMLGAGCGSTTIIEAGSGPFGSGSDGDGATAPGAGGASTITEGYDYEGVGACGPGLPGPAMVEIERPDGSRFCIDSTEVSNAQFLEFFPVMPQRMTVDLSFAGDAEVECRDDDLQEHFTLVVGEPGYDHPDELQRPFVYGTYCHYEEYCAWAGKRLCGGPDGRLLGPSEDDPQTNEWVFACSAGEDPSVIGTTPDECHVSGDVRPNERLLSRFWNVDDQRCEGPFPGLFNMVGNAGEVTRRLSNGELGNTGIGASLISSAETRASCDAKTFAGTGSPFNGFRCCRSLD